MSRPTKIKDLSITDLKIAKDVVYNHLRYLDSKAKRKNIIISEHQKSYKEYKKWVDKEKDLDTALFNAVDKLEA